MAAGDWYSMVQKYDGSLWSTGANLYGQLGDGSTVSTQLKSVSAPIHVMSGVAAIAAGNGYSIFLKQE